jgi:hypothetical protein
VWWANPLSPVLFLVMPMLIMAWALPDHVYFEQWQEPKYFGFAAMVRHLAGVLVLCIGALLATRGRLGLAARQEWPALSPVARQMLRRSFFALYRITCAAYLVWLAFAVQRGLRPSALLDTLRSQDSFGGTLKAQFATVGGVTTFTQVGIAASIVGALLTSRQDKAISRRVAVLVALAIVRGFFLAERLAIIEVILPFLVVRSGQLAATRSRPAGRLLVRLGPVFAIPLLMTGFALFEYSRSWAFAKTRTDSSFVEYSAYRLAGYYATSFNNGELYTITTDRTDRLPFYTVQFLWEAPVISSVFPYTEVVGQPPVPEVLPTKANPEFNSSGGVSAPFIDYGVVGGMFYFFGLGLLVGVLYRQFAGSRLIGLFLYPVFFIGLLEMPRYLYWAQGRATPAIAALLITSWLTASRSRRVRAALVNVIGA